MFSSEQHLRSSSPNDVVTPPRFGFQQQQKKLNLDTDAFTEEVCEASNVGPQHCHRGLVQGGAIGWSPKYFGPALHPATTSPIMLLIIIHNDYFTHFVSYNAFHLAKEQKT